MKQLSHNGVIVPKYEPKGFHILFRGKKIALTSEQEEMAVVWVKKLGTDYVKDKVFERNFFDDFGAALGVKEKISPEDIDFSEIIKMVEKERNDKLNMPKEERKRLAQERKNIREANKEKHGYVVVDGERIEVSNYVVEPSSIFMGRGKHPLRGKWKEGAKENDIIINLSPDSKVPEGKWKKIIWEPDFMWIAKWDDKLHGKEKYVWLSDTSRVKQEREKEKFDKARELEKEYGKVKKHIVDNLKSEDFKRRKTATVCYLIDALSMRVGDEKDEDEADTVGATTLTKDNVIIKENNLVKFDFLGKDSVRWEKEIVLPEQVVKNLKEFISNSESEIFDGVRSENVKLFLSEVVPGLTSKVFRTFHASKAVDDYLKKTDVKKEDLEDYKKYFAAMANLQASVVCNHKRTLPKNWEQTLQKKIERLKLIKEKIAEKGRKSIEVLESRIKKLEAMKQTEKRKLKLGDYKNKLKILKTGEMTGKDDENIKKLELKVETMKETKDYNLNTSLKSYIDPRIYWKWSKKVNFDWKKYYPKTLQRKFSWIEEK
jgi:DNA topoisomerase-1